MLMKTYDWPAEDETIASQTDLPILVTSLTRGDAEQIARHFHGAGSRAAAPFVTVHADTLPEEPGLFEKRCATVFELATGGTVFLSLAEGMSPAAQEALIGVLDRRRRTWAPTTAARLITGTTVPLIERVRAGTFSERLFYRLNVIHLFAVDRSFAPVTPPATNTSGPTPFAMALAVPARS